MKMKFMRSASGPRSAIRPAISFSMVGQIEGQLVKPNTTTLGLPLKSLAVTARPVWSISRSGSAESPAFSAPMPEPPPQISSMAAIVSARITSGKAVRGIG
jgi:hypothetical protein